VQERPRAPAGGAIRLGDWGEDRDVPAALRPDRTRCRAAAAAQRGSRAMSTFIAGTFGHHTPLNVFPRFRFLQC
jgi:hypothetical protein